MALNVHKASTVALQRPRLSRLGKTVLFIAIAVLLILIVGVGVARSRAQQEALRAQPLQDAIDYSLTVCRQLTSSSDFSLNPMPLKSVNGYDARIQQEKSVAERAELAQQMIAEITPALSGNPKAADELNGCRNRIDYALRTYKNKGR